MAGEVLVERYVVDNFLEDFFLEQAAYNLFASYRVALLLLGAAIDLLALVVWLVGEQDLSEELYRCED